MLRCGYCVLHGKQRFNHVEGLVRSELCQECKSVIDRRAAGVIGQLQHDVVKAIMIEVAPCQELYLDLILVIRFACPFGRDALVGFR